MRGDSNSISKTAEGEYATTFRDAAVYLSIAVPSKEAFLRFARDPRLYVATQARRQRIEGSYKKLDAKDKAKFDTAMKRWISSFWHRHAEE